MYWLRLLGSMVDTLFKTNGHRDVVSVPENTDPVLRQDVALTAHFSLFELTVTSNASLQGLNHTLTDKQVDKLTVLANHAEVVREICGAPINIHSGYRNDALNGVTVGSSSTSQHPKCEALDLDVKGQTVEQTFNLLLAAARAGKFKFGQLIIEQAERSYGVAQWVHCSVIGTLDPDKVGQVMKMEAGPDGKPNYVLIDHLKFPG